MNQQNKNLIYWLVIMLNISLLIFVVYYVIDNAVAFTENPFLYGASKMGDVECYCTEHYGTGNFANFYFNSTDIKFNLNE